MRSIKSFIAGAISVAVAVSSLPVFAAADEYTQDVSIQDTYDTEDEYAPVFVEDILDTDESSGVSDIDEDVVKLASEDESNTAFGEDIEGIEEDDTASVNEVVSGTCGKNLTWTLDNKGTLTINGSGAMDNGRYRSLFNGYEDRILKVIIEDNVVSIGDYVFQNCSVLSEITLPNSLTSIGDNAFKGCNSLSEISFPDSLTSIGLFAFKDCSSLSKISLPNSLTSIGSSAFNGTAYYNNDENWDNGVLYIGNALIKAKNDIVGGDIYIKEGTRIISNSAFEGCSSLNKINIPNGVTSIGDLAFWRCSSLSEISLPDSLTTIEGGTFEGCSSLSKINIPNGITSIGSEAFEYCSSLSKINIPYGVTSIGRRAFGDCSSLSEISLPDSLTSIGDLAFSGCSSLSKITLPDSLTTIGYNAFYGTAYYNNDENWDNGILYMGNVLIKAKSDIVSGDIYVKEGTRIISYEAFRECSSLSKINLPESVTSIEVEAFRECSSLSKINLPESVTSIEVGAFYECYNLREIKLPDSVTSIGYNAFYGTAYYNNDENWDNELLYIGNALISVRSDIVNGYISVKEGTKFISDSAFEYCRSLSEIDFPDSLTSIGTSAFRNCSSLSKITIPAGVTTIESYAFYGCSNLKDVYYKGSSSQWSKILIDSENEYLTNANIHFEDVEPSVVPTYAVEITASKEVTENGNVKVGINLSQTAVGELIIAQYDENNRFLGLKKQNTTENTTDYTEEMPNVENSSLKIMLWKDTSSMSALAEEVILR